MNVFQMLKVLRDHRGGQTLEWIVVAAFIMAIGTTVYGGANGTMTIALTNAGNFISTNLSVMAAS